MKYRDTLTLNSRNYWSAEFDRIVEETVDTISGVAEVIDVGITVLYFGEGGDDAKVTSIVTSIVWQVEADDLWNLYEAVYEVLSATSEHEYGWPDRSKIIES